MKKNINLFKVSLFLVCATFLSAQTIELKPVSVEASAIQEEHINSTTVITQEKAQERRDITMDEKLRADVTFSTVINDKGENSVSFRGLDYKSTKYIEDGVPLFSGITGIDVNFLMPSGDVYFNDGSGVSSLGVSSMGGEVSINKKIPLKSFESKFLVNVSTNDQLYSAYAGSIVDDLYIQADASYFYRKSFTLSNDFKATSVQPKRERVNSDKTQKNFSLKLGYFLTDELHIALKGNYAHSISGVAPNTTEDINYPSFFAYTRLDPKEMKDIYFYLDYDIADYELSARIYYDDYTDSYKVYEDSSYTNLHIFAQDVVMYEDNRIGAVLKVLRDKNAHKSTFVFLAEDYEHNRVGGFPENAMFKTSTINGSLSDIWKVNNNFILESGLSYTNMKPLKAAESSATLPVDDKSIFDGQLKLQYKTKQSSTYAGVAKKSRMPTMDEMMTFFPWIISNPGLKPEQSMQYTLGTSYKVNSKTEILFDTYYYDVKDIIVYESLSGGKNQFVNRESALHYGAEIRLNVENFYKQDLSFSYGYSQAEDNAGEKLELIPEHSVRVEDTIKFSRNLSLFCAYSFMGNRYSLNSATQTSEKEKLDSYNLLDTQLVYNLHRSTKLRGGIKNILDENYEYNYGYPAQGRSLYMSLEVAL